MLPKWSFLGLFGRRKQEAQLVGTTLVVALSPGVFPTRATTRVAPTYVLTPLLNLYYGNP